MHGATATDLTDFGDPVADLTDYALCIYGSAGLSREYLVAGASECRGKPCWRATSGGFKFSHPEAMPDGLRQMQLKAGSSGGGAIKVVGKGPLLGLPSLPLASPTTVQLQAATGECWGATFSTPIVNNVDGYKGQSN